MMNDASQFVSCHNLLPLDAQAMLRRAAATKVPESDPLARVRAVDQAIKRIKREHPHLFTAIALNDYVTTSAGHGYHIPTF